MITAVKHFNIILKDQLASKNASTASSTTNESSSDTATSSVESEYFSNCTELRKVYPNGVPSDHPAYQSKMDRDKDKHYPFRPF